MNINEATEKTREIFQSVITGLEEDFSNEASFSDLGGVSMDAMKIQMEIRKQFGKKISVETLYDLGSVSKIAERILQ